MIIDFHTHVFPDSISEKALHKLATAACCAPHTAGTLDSLRYSMEKNGVDYSVTLPAVTNPMKVTKINDQVIEDLEKNFNQGIIGFGGMHPAFTDYKAECKRLREHGVKGIKLHPAYQEMDINSMEMKRVIEAASNEGLVVLTHAGIDIGLYDKNYCSVEQILDVVDTVHPEKFVLAHMGNWAQWDQVESDLAGADVYLDTAFTIGEISPYEGAQAGPYRATLSDHDFVRICRKHGFDRILFATDSPWQDQGYYIDLIKEMNLGEERNNSIFYKNAAELLGLATV